jgi:hypothetical protein
MRWLLLYAVSEGLCLLITWSYSFASVAMDAEQHCSLINGESSLTKCIGEISKHDGEQWQ